MKRLVSTIVISAFCAFAAIAQPKDTLRVLGFGNSWTRDSMRWLSAIAKSAGKPLIVGHAYLGGSTLENQYYGIDDENYQYKHGTKMQTVHSTYQYWKYVCSVNPEKTPADADYKNGTRGIGITLESVVKDEPWDIIIFQPAQSSMGGPVFDRYIGRSSGKFTMNVLIDRVKAMMKPEVAARVKTGLFVPFSYPKGCLRHGQNMADAYAGGTAPSDQEGWDVLFENAHSTMQSNAPILAEYMGDRCSFIVNVGLAIHEARADELLSKSGYLLQRSQENTHLSEGISMYVASLCYAYELLGISKDEAVFYPEKSKDPHLSGDTGKTVYTTTLNTPEMAQRARDIAWKAQKETPLR